MATYNDNFAKQMSKGIAQQSIDDSDHLAIEDNILISQENQDIGSDDSLESITDHSIQHIFLDEQGLEYHHHLRFFGSHQSFNEVDEEDSLLALNTLSVEYSVVA
jgi:hypothetical protein